jgi:hypothetical protein
VTARMPRPGEHVEGEGAHPTDQADRDMPGDSPLGVHAQDPAEGRPDVPASAGAAQSGAADVAGSDNPLEETPAQSVAPDVERSS